jgi:hypothetical protein
MIDLGLKIDASFVSLKSSKLLDVHLDQELS